jgi:hypothetical protein
MRSGIWKVNLDDLFSPSLTVMTYMLINVTQIDALQAAARMLGNYCSYHWATALLIRFVGTAAQHQNTYAKICFVLLLKLLYLVIESNLGS